MFIKLSQNITYSSVQNLLTGSFYNIYYRSVHNIFYQSVFIDFDRVPISDVCLKRDKCLPHEDCKMISNPTLRTLMLTTVAAFVLSACGEPEVLQGQAPAAPKVDVAQVLQERVTEWDEFTGRLQAPESVTLVPRVSGYIASVNFKEGALVKKGDVLFRIDASVFEAEVARLKADLASALSADQLATNDLERARKLFVQKAVSAELLDTRESNKRDRKSVV